MSIKGTDSNSKGLTLKKEELFSQEAYFIGFPAAILILDFITSKISKKKRKQSDKMKNYNNIKILMKIAALIII